MKYKRMSQEEAEPGWNEVFEASLDSCMHGAYCQQGADCQVSVSACLLACKAFSADGTAHAACRQSDLGYLQREAYGVSPHPQDSIGLC